jgi:hypothetical protein
MELCLFIEKEREEEREGGRKLRSKCYTGHWTAGRWKLTLGWADSGTKTTDVVPSSFIHTYYIFECQWVCHTSDLTTVNSTQANITESLALHVGGLTTGFSTSPPASSELTLAMQGTSSGLNGSRHSFLPPCNPGKVRHRVHNLYKFTQWRDVFRKVTIMTHESDLSISWYPSKKKNELMTVTSSWEGALWWNSPLQQFIYFMLPHYRTLIGIVCPIKLYYE